MFATRRPAEAPSNFWVRMISSTRVMTGKKSGGGGRRARPAFSALGIAAIGAFGLPGGLRRRRVEAINVMANMATTFLVRRSSLACEMPTAVSGCSSR